MRAGEVIDGRFEVEALAGSGGMGSVYRALDRESGRPVAIKVLTDAAASDTARFAREARILGALDHPNIVRYVGHGTTPERQPYLTLEWLSGVDLAMRLRSGPLDVRETLRLGRVVARALAAAHGRGVVHRDVKPGNVFLVEGRVELAKVLDFGIARTKLRTRAHTMPGTALGTPAYMAPEQARGASDVDARADLFSLGCVLFECLTGQPPFVGAHLMALLAKILFEEPPRVSELRTGIPPELDALVARLLQKSPADRPETADEVALDLDAIVAPSAEAASTASAAPRATEITGREQRLLAVVLCAQAGTALTGDDAATVDATSIASVSLGLAAIAESFGVQFSPLAGGSTAAVLRSDGAATGLAVRAARCAIAMQTSAAETPLDIAIAIGRGETSARAPTGEVIDRAVTLVGKRVRAAAGSSRIRIDDATAGLLGERFEVGGDDDGLFLVREHEAIDAVRPLLGRESPFVGRKRELALALGTVDDCIEESSARTMVVTGEAGSGKSRLRRELAKAVAERGTKCDLWLGRGDPIAIGAPFGVLASLLVRLCHLSDGEPLSVRQRKLRARVERALAGDGATHAAEFLGEIVGASSDAPSVQLKAARADPTVMGDQIARAFEELVEAEARATPVVLVLEDLQWGDAVSVRLVEGAIRRCQDLPLFVLALARPDSGLSSRLASGSVELTLGPISSRAAEELVRSALPEPTEPMVADLVARAAGNPCYLEELVRCAASGAAGALPPTILAVLQARLDALAPEPRRVLRAASVYGRVFWSGGVERLLGGASRTQPDTGDFLPVLVAEELVVRRPSSRFLGETEYEFRNAHLREAVYASFTDQDRATGHRLAGTWLAEKGEHAPLVLAEHFERGGAHSRAARALLEAASEALEGHDVSLALSLVRRARSAVGWMETADDGLRGAVALREAEVARWGGDLEAAERAAVEAMEILPKGSAPWFRAAMEAMNAAGRRGAYEMAIDWYDSVASVPAEGDARSARALALCAAGRQLFHAGGYEVANELIDSLERETSGDDEDPLVTAEIHRLLGARARHVGDLAGDLEHYERTLEAYERAGDVRQACNARVSVGFAHVELGDYALARAHLDRALEEARRMGLAPVVTRAEQNLGLVLVHEGQLDEARALLDRVVRESHEQGNVRFEGWSRVYLARAHLAAGDLPASRAEAEHAARLLEVTPPARAGALATLSLACIASSRATDAEIHARGALAVLEAFGGIEEFESLVWLAAVRSALASGDSATASARLWSALARLDARAAAIADPERRASFLERVAENAELRALCADLGEPPLEPPRLLRDVYSADAFAADATLLVERVRAHLARALAGEGQVVPGRPSPAEMLARFDHPFPEEPSDALSSITDAILERSTRQHHPRYLGYQVSAPVPRATLLSMVAAALNSGMAAFDSGPVPTAMERRVIEWMCGLAGYRDGGGVLTSGGSLGNLTALLAARQAHDAGGRTERLAILCADQAHYSIERAAQIMGLGRDAVVSIASDDAYRMSAGSIEPAAREARARGLTPFALVASAGSTGTGSIDPLDAIADECERLGLWLHVDGAHGASALLSATHREALRGIERSRSLVWDAHKLMAMPALCTAVLFRDAHDSYGTFAQRAEYLFEERGDEPWWDIGRRTIECTKPLLSVPIYVCLATLGTRFFASLVDHGYALARRFASILEAADDFELACSPETNILCFRHVPSAAADGVDLDAHQRGVRDRLREDGSFYVVTTVLGGSTWLRTTLMSPMTSERDVRALLEAIRAVR